MLTPLTTHWPSSIRRDSTNSITPAIMKTIIKCSNKKFNEDAKRLRDSVTAVNNAGGQDEVMGYNKRQGSRLLLKRWAQKMTETM